MSDPTGPRPPRKVIANIAVSIDGYTAADPADGMGGMGWLLEYAVHEQTRAQFEGVYRGVSTALLGRTNYEGFHGYWPTVAKDSTAEPRDRDFANWLDAVEKVVFSGTLTSVEWRNARIAKDLEAEVRTLRDMPGRDILVLSSGSIIRALMELDLLDELHMAVLPSVLGDGSRLFPATMSPSTWRLAGTTTFPTGAVGLQYCRP